MHSIAIQAEGLSKRYHIGAAHRTYDRLGDKILDVIASPFRRVGKLLHGQATGAAELDEVFWALKEISFEIHYGDVVGIIGRNGAGKSTLLKILSQITEPTQGHADIFGRVGSLLEVGTGFHPELTGRENIFLNGAILGMKRSEIEQRFDEIVAFSEIGRFIDTPVKHYSSGMYVRLAFAVAAHLEPEILLVDEVLAVGDLAFQKKCLGRMANVTKQGRTVLFVSHNMAAIRNICRQVIWLADGQIKAIGDVDDIVTQYEDEVLQYQTTDAVFEPIVNHQYGLSLEGISASVVPAGEHANLQIEVELSSIQPVRRIGIGIRIYTHDGFLVAKLVPAMTNIVIEKVDGRCRCLLECASIEQYLAGGEYLISLGVTFPKADVVIQVENVAKFRVPDFDPFSSGQYFTQKAYGLIPLPLRLKESQGDGSRIAENVLR